MNETAPVDWTNYPFPNDLLTWNVPRAVVKEWTCITITDSMIPTNPISLCQMKNMTNDQKVYTRAIQFFLNAFVPKIGTEEGDTYNNGMRTFSKVICVVEPLLRVYQAIYGESHVGSQVTNNVCGVRYWFFVTDPNYHLSDALFMYLMSNVQRFSSYQDRLNVFDFNERIEAKCKGIVQEEEGRNGQPGEAEPAPKKQKKAKDPIKPKREEGSKGSVVFNGHIMDRTITSRTDFLNQVFIPLFGVKNTEEKMRELRRLNQSNTIEIMMHNSAFSDNLRENFFMNPKHWREHTFAYMGDEEVRCCPEQLDINRYMVLDGERIIGMKFAIPLLAYTLRPFDATYTSQIKQRFPWQSCHIEDMITDLEMIVQRKLTVEKEDKARKFSVKINPQLRAVIQKRNANQVFLVHDEVRYPKVEGQQEDEESRPLGSQFNPTFLRITRLGSGKSAEDAITRTKTSESPSRLAQEEMQRIYMNVQSLLYRLNEPKNMLHNDIIKEISVEGWRRFSLLVSNYYNEHLEISLCSLFYYYHKMVNNNIEKTLYIKKATRTLQYGIYGYSRISFLTMIDTLLGAYDNHVIIAKLFEMAWQIFSDGARDACEKNGQHPLLHMAMLAQPGYGKSFWQDLVTKLSIPGTVSHVAGQTDRLVTVADQNHQLIMHDENNMGGARGTHNSDDKSINLRLSTLAGHKFNYDRTNINPSTGVMSAQRVSKDCNTSHIVSGNTGFKDPAMESRIPSYILLHQQRFDKTLLDIISRIVNDEQRTEQENIFQRENLTMQLAFGILLQSVSKRGHMYPDTSMMTAALKILESEVELNQLFPDLIKSMRTSVSLTAQARIEANRYAIYWLLFCEASPLCDWEKGGACLPFHLDHFRLAEPAMVCTFSAVIYLVSEFIWRRIGVAAHLIMRWLAKALANYDYNKLAQSNENKRAHFLQRDRKTHHPVLFKSNDPKESQELDVDYNYIVFVMKDHALISFITDKIADNVPEILKIGAQEARGVLDDLTKERIGYKVGGEYKKEKAALWIRDGNSKGNNIIGYALNVHFLSQQPLDIVKKVLSSYQFNGTPVTAGTADVELVKSEFRICPKYELQDPEDWSEITFEENKNNPSVFKIVTVNELVRVKDMIDDEAYKLIDPEDKEDDMETIVKANREIDADVVTTYLKFAGVNLNMEIQLVQADRHSDYVMKREQEPQKYWLYCEEKLCISIFSQNGKIYGVNPVIDPLLHETYMGHVEEGSMKLIKSSGCIIRGERAMNDLQTDFQRYFRRPVEMGYSDHITGIDIEGLPQFLKPMRLHRRKKVIRIPNPNYTSEERSRSIHTNHFSQCRSNSKGPHTAFGYTSSDPFIYLHNDLDYLVFLERARSLGYVLDVNEYVEERKSINSAYPRLDKEGKLEMEKRFKMEHQMEMDKWMRCLPNRVVDDIRIIQRNIVEFDPTQASVYNYQYPSSEISNATLHYLGAPLEYCDWKNTSGYISRKRIVPSKTHSSLEKNMMSMNLQKKIEEGKNNQSGYIDVTVITPPNPHISQKSYSPHNAEIWTGENSFTNYMGESIPANRSHDNSPLCGSFSPSRVSDNSSKSIPPNRVYDNSPLRGSFSPSRVNDNSPLYGSSSPSRFHDNYSLHNLIPRSRFHDNFSESISPQRFQANFSLYRENNPSECDAEPFKEYTEMNSVFSPSLLDSPCKTPSFLDAYSSPNRSVKTNNVIYGSFSTTCPPKSEKNPDLSQSDNEVNKTLSPAKMPLDDKEMSDLDI